MLGESCVDVGDNGSLPQFSSFVPECVSSFEDNCAEANLLYW